MFHMYNIHVYVALRVHPPKLKKKKEYVLLSDVSTAELYFLTMVRLYLDYCYCPRFRYKSIILAISFWPDILRTWKSSLFFS